MIAEHKYKAPGAPLTRPPGWTRGVSLMPRITIQRSPEAAADLEVSMDYDEMGTTDCPQGCEVEPDGTCSHGFQSAGLTLGVI